MKFPQTTPTSKLAIKIGASLFLLTIIFLLAGWGLASGICGALSAANLLAAVFFKNY